MYGGRTPMGPENEVFQARPDMLAEKTSRHRRDLRPQLRGKLHHEALRGTDLQTRSRGRPDDSDSSTPRAVKYICAGPL